MAVFLKLMVSQHCEINLEVSITEFISLSKIRWDRLEWFADSKDEHIKNFVSFR